MADFTGFRPQWGLSITPERKTLVSDTEAGGLGIRRQKWQNPRYRIRFRSVHFGANAVTEANALNTLFETTCKGQKNTFTANFTVDGSSVNYTCRFATDALPRTLAGLNRYEFDIELLAVKT